ncbi:MAG: hypothetical protein R2939_14110 [Kofleriaceae bacterium]
MRSRSPAATALLALDVEHRRQLGVARLAAMGGSSCGAQAARLPAPPAPDQERASAGVGGLAREHLVDEIRVSRAVELAEPVRAQLGAAVAQLDGGARRLPRATPSPAAWSASTSS